MISNERPSPFYGQPRREPYRQPYSGQQQPYGFQQQPRPPVHEDTLKTFDFTVERKSFRLTLKENSRGRFLRVTESNGSNFNSIVVPATGLVDFQRMLNEMVAEQDDELADHEAQPTQSPEVHLATPEAPVPAVTMPQPKPEAKPVPVPESKPAAQIPVSSIDVVTPEPKPEPKPKTKSKAAQPKAAKPQLSTKVKAVPKKAKAASKAKG
jgi:hypothetical protein